MSNRSSWMTEVNDVAFAEDVAEWFDEYSGRSGPGVAAVDAAEVFEALAHWLRQQQEE